MIAIYITIAIGWTVQVLKDGNLNILVGRSKPKRPTVDRNNPREAPIISFFEIGT